MGMGEGRTITSHIGSRFDRIGFEWICGTILRAGDWASTRRRIIGCQNLRKAISFQKGKKKIGVACNNNSILTTD